MPDVHHIGYVVSDLETGGVPQRSEPLLAFYAQVRAAAPKWDGADPIRSVA